MARTKQAPQGAKTGIIVDDDDVSTDEIGDNIEVSATTARKPVSSSSKLKPPSTSRGASRNQKKQPSPAIVVDDSQEEQGEEDDQPVASSSKHGTATATGASNRSGGAKSANGKAGAAAGGKTARTPLAVPDEPADSEEVEMELDDNRQASVKPTGTSRARMRVPEKTSRGTANRQTPSSDRDKALALLERQIERQKERDSMTITNLEAEVERLRTENQSIARERDIFQRQFAEVSQLRKSQPEAALEAFREQSEGEAATQDAVIKTLTSEISGMEELSRDGHTHGLKLLTREATDARLREMSASLAQREAEVKDLTRQLAAATHEIGVLKDDLAVEQEHFKKETSRLQAKQYTLAANSPPTSRNPASNRVNAERTTIHEESIKILEDLSGCAILNAISEPRDATQGGGVCWKFRCLCKVAYDEDFTFELTVFPPAPADEEGRMESEVMFVPLLDAGPGPSQTVRDRLDWMQNGFTFSRSQMSTLCKQLLDVAHSKDDDGEEEEEDAEGHSDRSMEIE